MKIRSMLWAAAALSLTSNLAFADDALKAKYEEKIAKPFVSHGSWCVDFDEARERATKDGKLIFVYFTRSYSG